MNLEIISVTKTNSYGMESNVRVGYFAMTDLCERFDCDNNDKYELIVFVRFAHKICVIVFIFM